ncbi:MAG: porin [Nitrospirota bacterium]
MSTSTQQRIASKLLIVFLAVVSVITIAIQQADSAGITVYKEGDKYVKLGGRIQFQYHYKDPDSGGASDSVFFRRLRPYIKGSLHKDWTGKFQWDMGKNEVAVKDAYIQYTGFKDMKVSVGNANFPFSREYLTSSKKQQLVERTFVGDHNYGTLARNAGVHITGHFADKKVTYGISGASASIDPDAEKLDFDTPVNRNSDFNEGWIIGGRADFHPFGEIKMSQGDFNGKTRAAIGVAAFRWNNDGDNNTSGTKPDVDSVTGLEVSSAIRSNGLSVDGEYNMFDADTVDSAVTKGIYRNGNTKLKNFALEGGYMLIGDKLEIVAGYQVQDADNYDTKWNRTSFGANWFFKKHDIKTQLTYQLGKNLKGVRDSDENELFVQMQYVF